MFPNDFLREEFRRRVGPGRSLRVCRLITDALKLLGEKVSKKESNAEQAETQHIAQLQVQAPGSVILSPESLWGYGQQGAGYGVPAAGFFYHPGRLTETQDTPLPLMLAS